MTVAVRLGVLRLLLDEVDAGAAARGEGGIERGDRLAAGALGSAAVRDAVIPAKESVRVTAPAAATVLRIRLAARGGWPSRMAHRRVPFQARDSRSPSRRALEGKGCGGCVVKVTAQRTSLGQTDAIVCVNIARSGHPILCRTRIPTGAPPRQVPGSAVERNVLERPPGGVARLAPPPRDRHPRAPPRSPCARRPPRPCGPGPPARRC